MTDVMLKAYFVVVITAIGQLVDVEGVGRLHVHHEIPGAGEGSFTRDAMEPFRGAVYTARLFGRIFFVFSRISSASVFQSFLFRIFGRIRI